MAEKIIRKGKRINLISTEDGLALIERILNGENINVKNEVKKLTPIKFKSSK